MEPLDTRKGSFEVGGGEKMTLSLKERTRQVKDQGAQLTRIVIQKHAITVRADGKLALRDERTPSAQLYPDGHVHDFGSGEHLTALDFMSRMEKINIADDFVSALEHAEDLLGIHRNRTPREEWKDAVHELASRRGWRVEALLAAGAVPGGENDCEVHFPMHDADWNVVGWRRRRRDNKPFGRHKVLTVKGGSNGILGAKPWLDGTVLLTEGEADGAAARSAGWESVVEKPGAKPGKKVLVELQKLLAGRDVVLAPDPDKSGREGAEQTAQALANAGCRVFILPAIDVDLDKRLARVPEAERKAELARWIAEAVEWKPKPDVADASKVPGELQLTDIGNAAVLAERLRGEFLYATDAAAWLHFDGKRYALESASISLAVKAREIPKHWLKRALAAKDEKIREVLLSFAKASSSKRSMANATDLAKSADPALLTRLSDFDADPDILNCANGQLDLRTGRIEPHAATQRNTKAIAVAFDPDAKCPRWDRFLLEIFDGDRELTSYMQRLFGYFLTGHVNEQGAWFFFGSGANGKSVTNDTMQRLMGGYAARVPSEIFVEDTRTRNAGDAAPHLIQLRGARLAVASESKPGARLAEAALKDLSGGDRVTARELYKNPVTFDPTWKLVLATNHRPRATADPALWRRIRLVPFEVSFKGREDKGLPDKLKAELPGILAWAVRGCLEWRRTGLCDPPRVLAATEDYRRQEDVVGRFLDECTVRGGSYSVQSRRLFNTFKEWCEDGGEHVWSETAFGRRMTETGLRKRHNREGKFWFGIRLRNEDDPSFVTGCDGLEGSPGNFSREGRTSESFQHNPSTRHNPSQPEKEADMLDDYERAEREAIQDESKPLEGRKTA